MDEQLLKTFLKKLENIIQELRKLEILAYNFVDSYEECFSTQQFYIDKLENVLEITTHETRTDLEFRKECILNLVHYIQFWDKYNTLPEEIIKEVVDCDNTDVRVKLKLKQYADKADYRSLFNEIKSDWQHHFHLLSFEKLKENIK